MATSINKVTLLGNLGQEPELRTTASGIAICTLSIATSERYKDKTTGEWKEVTDWHRVTLWDNLANRANDYLHKGSKIYLEGRLKYGSYDGKDGQKVYTTDIYATDFIMLSPKDIGGTGSYERPIPEEFQNQNRSNNNSNSNSITDQLASHLTNDVEEDDVPF